MSIGLVSLISRLEKLNSTAVSKMEADRSILVTFDDGWIDPMLLFDFFRSATKLQPVLFLTHGQISGHSGLLPLARLYEWCDSQSLDINSIKNLGISRSEMKLLPEKHQHSILDKMGIPPSNTSRQVLSVGKIEFLQDNGWLIGSHAHDHRDLRKSDMNQLELGLKEALESLKKIGGVPWLAWPEGRCSKKICELASKIGFEKQFSLNIESGNIDFPGLLHREIWSE
tara:strand:+ start:398 stop:1078 length:681 start_codon:yes stop_codon:yes gene_type:complete